MLQGKWNDLSEVIETAVDSGVVRSDQRAIWTPWRVNMEALDEISRWAIRAVAMLGVGEVPECVMRHVVNECVTEASERDESSPLFYRVVKRNLVDGSSLLTEEAERGSFKLHPLIRHYVRSDVSLTSRRVCQDIALRAVHRSIVEEEVEQRSTVISSEQVRMRGVWRLHHMRWLLCGIRLKEERWYERRRRSLWK